MLSPRRRWRALALVGLLLLANPLYAYPAGLSPTYHYELAPVDPSDPEDVYRALRSAPDVVVCPTPRPCALEQRIDEEGPIVRDVPVSDPPPYDVVLVSGGWVRPTYERNENGTVTLDHEPLTPAEALDAAAISAAGPARTPELVDVAERGELWGDRSIPELDRGYVVEHEGTYYRLSAKRYERSGLDRPGVLLVRVFGGGLGLLALWGARRERRRAG